MTKLIFQITDQLPSLFSLFSKIFERTIKTILLGYLEENSFLPISQYGFRDGVKTEKAVA